jgi:diphosphomevalonate decarboxylase
MAALALCLMEMEKELIPEIEETYFTKKASFLARLGSGSACRSIEGNIMEWGSHPRVEGSSDLYAIPYPYEVNTLFRHYQDTILLVDKEPKKVSSTTGHNLLHGHPFAFQRFDQANNNVENLRKVMETGDINGFIRIVESEALTLHAMMMTSIPYFILMKPNTLKIIEGIWAFRKRSGTRVCFTLDAGANVHVLYPENEKEIVFQFIQDELVAFCEKAQYICDRIGEGARKA